MEFESRIQIFFKSIAGLSNPPTPWKVKKTSNEHYAWGPAIPKLRDIRECDNLILPHLGALGWGSPDTAKKAYPETVTMRPLWLL